MDRVEIKSLAKEKIKGNLWNIWWPLLVICLISGLAGSIGGALSNSLGTIGAIISSLISIAASLLGASYTAYLMKLTRGEEADFNTIIDCLKNKWLQLLITSLLVAIYVFLWSMLFVIPGIIKGLAYSMALLIVIDTDLSGNDAIRESMRMMDGYKWNYFVFQLSFIGWILLAPLTFGLLYIWLLPYMMTAEILYYDKLREKTGTPVAAKVEETEVKEEAVVTTEPEPVATSESEKAEEDNDPISNNK